MVTWCNGDLLSWWPDYLVISSSTIVVSVGDLVAWKLADFFYCGDLDGLSDEFD